MRIVFLIGFVFSALSTGQTVDLKGRVVDNDFQPVENALVKLVKRNSTDTTDAEGYFHLVKQQTRINESCFTGGSFLNMTGGVLTIIHNSPVKSASLHIYNLEGKLVLALPVNKKSGNSCGFNIRDRINESFLSNALYIIRLTINSSIYHFKTADIHREVQGYGLFRLHFNENSISSGSIKAASGSITDTLIVRKSGFINKRLALPTFVGILDDITLGRQFSIIDSNLVDAEYSAQLGIVVAACSLSNHAVLFCPETEVKTVLALPKKPKCVSVSLDGKYAVIGHDSIVMYIDLENKAVKNECPLPCNMFDIVLGRDSYAYSFSLNCSNILCTNLNTGEVTPGGTHASGMRAKMHPSGKYIYATNVGISPGDFYRYTIESDTISDWYDSPYHGGYGLGGDIWVSEDGTLLFASSGSTCTSNPLRELDMLYSGLLGNEFSTIISASHSSRTNCVATISIGSNIDFYNFKYLNRLGALRLDTLVSPGDVASPRGKFIFFGKEGHTCTILVSGNGRPFSSYTLNDDQYPLK